MILQIVQNRAKSCKIVQIVQILQILGLYRSPPRALCVVALLSVRTNSRCRMAVDPVRTWMVKSNCFPPAMD